MKKILVILCLIIFNTTYADVPSNQATEVKHLLNFVRQSNCIINRNGTKHIGSEAVNHIENKYNYFRDEIRNTEDFIKYSATKSTLSGNYYTVTCNDKKTIKTQQWLLNELSQFRKSHTTNNLKNKSIICTDPRPQICTLEYMPVCATLNNKVTKTFASACSACANKKVISYKPDDC